MIVGQALMPAPLLLIYKEFPKLQFNTFAVSRYFCIVL